MSLSKAQKEVQKIYKHLRPVQLDTEKMCNNFYSVGQVRNGHIYCIFCGADCGEVTKHYTVEENKYSFENKLTPKKDKPVKCPHCHKELCHIDQHEYRHYIGYYSTFQKYGDWQVIRMHFVALHTRHGKHANFDVTPDNYQLWYNSKGERVTVGHHTCMNPRYCINPLSHWDELHIRQNTGDYVNDDNYAASITSLTPWFQSLIPNPRKISVLTIDKEMETIHKRQFHPYFETLDKLGYHELAKAISKNDMRLYHRQIRIAVFRNHYEISDWILYRDTLQMLRKLGYDTLSPKYICPNDLKKLHDKLSSKIHAIKQVEREKRELERHRTDDKDFQKRMERFFNLLFQKDDLVIKPLKSVQEFYEEGIAMEHCVFANGYYNQYHKNSLILAARTPDDKRLATIEVNLQNFQIVQIQAKCDKKSPYEEQIRQLIKTNISKIKKAAKRKTKKAA